MIGPILRRARKGNSRRIIMEVRLLHFSHNPRPAPFSAAPRNTNPIPGRFFVRLTTCVIVCGAYAVASYLNGKNLAPFFIHSTIAVVVCGTYAIRPYTGTRKNGDFSIRLTTGVVVCGAYAIRPYTRYMPYIKIRIRFPNWVYVSIRDTAMFFERGICFG